jgi:hypothetical protein
MLIPPLKWTGSPIKHWDEFNQTGYGEAMRMFFNATHYGPWIEKLKVKEVVERDLVKRLVRVHQDLQIWPCAG